jgi:hypothetical protein
MPFKQYLHEHVHGELLVSGYGDGKCVIHECDEDISLLLTVPALNCLINECGNVPFVVHAWNHGRFLFVTGATAELLMKVNYFVH